jgi:hypothetical protein
MSDVVNFKRMVLRLPPNATDYGSVAVVADLARRCGLDLLGLFVRDEHLREIATSLGSREICVPGGEWQSLDVTRLETELRYAPATARRLFHAAVKSPHSGIRFDEADGPLADVIASKSPSEDIVVVIAPQNPAERLTYQFLHLVESAFSAPTAVLLVPSGAAPRTEEVVVIAERAGDPSLAAALNVAASAKTRLTVISPPEVDRSALLEAAERGIAVEHRTMAPACFRLPETFGSPHRTNDRLIVLTRRPADERLLPRLSSELRIPILVTEPLSRRSPGTPEPEG